MRDTSRIATCSPRRCGSTKRVTSAAAVSPTIEYSPSCTRPGNPENSIDAKPHTDVSTPSRIVGQYAATQARVASAGRAAPRVPACADCTNR